MFLWDRPFWFGGFSHLHWCNWAYKLLLWVHLLGLIRSPNQWVNIPTIHTHLKIQLILYSLESQGRTRDRNNLCGLLNILSVLNSLEQ